MPTAVGAHVDPAVATRLSWIVGRSVYVAKRVAEPRDEPLRVDTRPVEAAIDPTLDRRTAGSRRAHDRSMVPSSSRAHKEA